MNTSKIPAMAIEALDAHPGRADLMARILPFILVAGLLPWLAGCTIGNTSQTMVPGPAGHPDAGVANYSTNTLQEGDGLNITFQYSTNFNVVQRIALDGTLNLEAIGKIRAAGKTPQQLESELIKLYEPQGGKDIITVKVTSPAATVYISGA